MQSDQEKSTYFANHTNQYKDRNIDRQEKKSLQYDTKIFYKIFCLKLLFLHTDKVSAPVTASLKTYQT